MPCVRRYLFDTGLRDSDRNGSIDVSQMSVGSFDGALKEIRMRDCTPLGHGISHVPWQPTSKLAELRTTGVQWGMGRGMGGRRGETSLPHRC